MWLVLTLAVMRASKQLLWYNLDFIKMSLNVIPPLNAFIQESAIFCAVVPLQFQSAIIFSTAVIKKLIYSGSAASSPIS